jgi:uncharacterized delta-60 repeat protein
VATYPQAGTANDGKIVVAGYAIPVSGRLSEQFALLRYNLNGILDASFGSTGQVLGPNGDARAVAVQPDGKIVAAGQQLSGGSWHFIVTRYNANGSLDTSFGSRGVVTTSIIGRSSCQIFAVTLQADGKIVVAGVTISANTTTNQALALARYNANGSLDTSFGTGGLAFDNLTTPSNLDTVAIGLAIDPGTGQIAVVANDPNFHLRVVRYTSNGSLDNITNDPTNSFGNGAGYETFDGSGQLPILQSGGAVAIQPSNHDIVVAGPNSGHYQSLARLKPDGTLDGGVTVTNIVAASFTYAVKLQADGGILVGANHGPTLMVTRYNTDLTLDTSFGTAGTAQYLPAAPAQNSLSGMALEPDGRIVVAGPDSSVTVVRFLATGPQIGVGSFTASPNPVPPPGSLTLTVSNIIDGNPGASVTQVEFYYYAGGNKVTLGTVTQATAGAWTLTSQNAFGLTTGTYTIYAQAEDSYGVFGDPVSISLTIQ